MSYSLLLLLSNSLPTFSQNPSSNQSFSKLGRANGLSGKIIVGYQGWFGCPGDDAKNRNWDHWFLKNADKENLLADMLPAMDDYDKADCKPSGMLKPDGSKVFLFSSLSSNVVKRHFHWMEQYGIDGAAIQRFVAETCYPELRSRRDKVLENVRAAAEASGRVFYVEYDVSNADEHLVYEAIRADWHHLVKDLRITSSPSYLRERGKPVLEIWGFGLTDRPGKPALVEKLLRQVKTPDGGSGGVTLIGGVPTCWRTLSGDSKDDAGWSKAYRTYDVISPWSVNRYWNELTAALFVKFMVLPDLDESRRLGIGYLPVIFPGFSRHNLMRNMQKPEKATFDAVPRARGKFYWRQIHELLAEAHVNTLFAAMFDEVNEGTALFKVESKQENLPRDVQLVRPQLDGSGLEPDFYLKLTGMAGKYLKIRSSPPSQLEKALDSPPE